MLFEVDSDVADGLAPTAGSIHQTLSPSSLLVCYELVTATLLSRMLFPGPEPACRCCSCALLICLLLRSVPLILSDTIVPAPKC